jgi:hypothetical protein
MEGEEIHTPRGSDFNGIRASPSVTLRTTNPWVRLTPTAGNPVYKVIDLVENGELTNIHFYSRHRLLGRGLCLRAAPSCLLSPRSAAAGFGVTLASDSMLA